MVKNELQALWHNKLLMLVLLVIVLIPAMYAGFFLASMWDPYGDLEYLPVAVVNKDKAVTYNEKELTIGDDLAENLEDNDSMAFNVVDENTAMKGLENGTYYMVITIPEDFSKNASSLMDDNPSKMMLDYKTNPGRNYISMKLSESAMKEIKANLTKEVTRTYAETMFDSFGEIENGFQDAVDGTDDMLDGETKLLDGNNTISENLLTLSDGSAELKVGTDTLLTGLEAYTDGVSKVNNGINGDLKIGVSQIAASLPNIKTLNDGANTLNTSVSAYTDGVETLSEGASQLNSNSGTLLGGLQTVSAGVDRLAAGGQSEEAGLSQVKGGIANAIVALGSTPEAAVAMASGAQANGNLGSSQTTRTETVTTTSVNQETIDSVNSDISSAQAFLASGTESINGANDVLSDAGTSITNASNSIASVLDAENLTEEQRGQLQDAMNNMSLGAGYLSSASGTLTGSIQDFSDADTFLTKISENASELPATTTTVTNETTQLLGTPTQPDIPTAIATLGVVYAGLGDDQSGLIGGMKQMNTGLNTLQSNLGDTETKNTLLGGMNTYTQGVKSLNDGAAQLASNNMALTAGTEKIAQGTDVLYASLSEGAPKLVAGVDQLGSGTKELVDKKPVILDGTEKLADGAEKISDGSQQLADGSLELGEGLVTLQDGTQTLHDALDDGKDELSENEASDATLDMFSEPVVLNETKVTEVENNGHAMAAYMFSVGIWVACLAFCLMYPLSKHTGELTNGRDWWASKAVILYPMAILMVVMLMLILHFALGFQPGSMVKTVIVALAAVACFMSIMYFFNLLLGKIGSFLMLLFMVLQLAGSAGTYPVEISGPLAQALNKWMPFTYSVNGFRAGIAIGGASIVHECIVLFGISIIFTLLTIGVFRIRSLRIKQGKPFLYDWLEEKGLA